uniref:Uncharacterized protein n=1 Tax=Panagrellus redivivus TaxID=6233 RepID=A0A7E4W523_PANRE
MSIYQAKLEFIDGEKLDCIKTASRVGRRYWSLPENHGKEAEFVLHLPLTWKSKKDNPLHEEHVDVFKKETEGGGGACLDATATGGKP